MNHGNWESDEIHHPSNQTATFLLFTGFVLTF
jgi:hypothetical protein